MTVKDPLPSPPRIRLFTPGPLNTSEPVRSAMGMDMGSRTSAFAEITARVCRGLEEISGCGPEFAAVPMQGSGTFAVEAMVSSLIPEGGSVLVVSNGVYADRMAQMCAIHGIQHVVLRSSDEAPFELSGVAQALDREPSVKYVLAVQFETAVGVLNDLQGLLAVAARWGCRVLVDAMSSFGAVPLSFDAPGLLAVAASSNKCLHGAPGVGFVIARKDALRQASPRRTLSLDLIAQREELERSGQWRFTPPTHVLRALDAAIAEFKRQGGASARLRKYEQLSEQLISGLAELDIRPVIPTRHRGPMITTFALGPSLTVDVRGLQAELLQRGLIIYPTGHSAPNSFRVGCMGELSADDIRELIEAIRDRVGRRAAAPHAMPRREGASSGRPLNIRITGPTPLPPAVRAAMGAQTISHRGEEFKAILSRVTDRLQAVLNSATRPVLFASSGTGGLEAAVVNSLARGDRVLALSAGHYGDLFARIARTHVGASVSLRQFPPGTRMDPDAVKQLLRGERFDAVLLTHAESSAGVLHPLAELTEVIRASSDALILVDAVGSLGATEFRMDSWGVDVVVAVTQKALMSPPGVAILAASERAQAVRKRRPAIGSFYFDWERSLQAQLESQTPFTPAVPVIRGLDAALAMMLEEGHANVFRRHARLAARCQRAVAEAGLTPFAEAASRSPAITAVRLPEEMLASEAQRLLEVEYGLLVATGLDTWREQTLRIAHMGWVSDEEMEQVACALAGLGRRLCREEPGR